MKKICTVYKSPLREGMYLYVDKRQGLSRVPGALLTQFGKPVQTMTLLLEPARKLARVDASVVAQAIEKEGFFLQLPEKQQDSYMAEIHQKNTRF